MRENRSFSGQKWLKSCIFERVNTCSDVVLYCDKEKILTEVNSLFDEHGMLKFFNVLRGGCEPPAIFYNIFGRQFIEGALKKINNKMQTSANALVCILFTGIAEFILFLQC